MNITQLKQGSLNGLRKQTNECLDAAYNKGLEDGNKIADKNFKEIQESAHDVAYNKGLEDAWELIKAIETDREFEEVFGEELENNFENVSIQDAMKKWKVYKEKKKSEEEIKVGDEVVITGLKDLETLGVVTMLANNNYMIICLINGSEMAKVTKNNIKPTGRHFEEISQLLNKLGGEEEQ